MQLSLVIPNALLREGVKAIAQAKGFVVAEEFESVPGTVTSFFRATPEGRYTVLHSSVADAMADGAQTQKIVPRRTLVIAGHEDWKVAALARLGGRVFVDEASHLVEDFYAAFDAMRIGKEIMPSRVALALCASDRFRLTPREREVLSLVAAGDGDAHIGRQLFISEHSVKKHLKSILSKLSARNRTEAAVKALVAGECNLSGLSASFSTSKGEELAS